jgi:signal transduction histidine kinase
VTVHREQTNLVVDVRSATAADLTEVEDRVGALDGRLAVDETPAGETHVRVELPCV